MALPGSGTITLNNVQTEFGGSNPIAITEYYGADTGVPGSGTIALSDFYGKSSGPPPTKFHSEWASKYYTLNGVTPIVGVGLKMTVYSDGTWSWQRWGSSNQTSTGRWLATGEVATGFQVRWTSYSNWLGPTSGDISQNSYVTLGTKYLQFSYPYANYSGLRNYGAVVTLRHINTSETSSINFRATLDW